jgi:ABC-2 type transport system permease protein
MTTASGVTEARVPPAAPAGRRVSFGSLLAAEWTKIRSVRSTMWTLVLFVVITVGLTALLSWLVSSSWTGPHAAARDATVLNDPVGFILGAGLNLGQLTLCVLGVLVISSEYSTGVIRASLLAVPKRLPMLAAKAVVLAALLFVVAEIVCFASFFLGSAILHSHVAVSLGERNVTRAVVGAGLSLTVLGLFSLGIGGIIRHTAGAITTTIGIVFVLPILGGLLPGSWGAHVNGYLPEQAGSLVAQQHPPAGGNVLSAWEGFGVFCIWAALALAVCAFVLRRRDA